MKGIYHISNKLTSKIGVRGNSYVTSENHTLEDMAIKNATGILDLSEILSKPFHIVHHI